MTNFVLQDCHNMKMAMTANTTSIQQFKVLRSDRVYVVIVGHSQLIKLQMIGNKNSGIDLMKGKITVQHAVFKKNRNYSKLAVR